MTEADGGVEALRILAGSSRFDLLITDVQMPGPPDGIGVAQHARARFPDMPIVFATARPDSIRGFKGRREFDAVVPKPYGPEQMLAAVRRIMATGSAAP